MKKERSYSTEELKNKIFRYINYRMRSKKEIEKKLTLLNASDQQKIDLIEELSKTGLIDDEKFIIFFIQEYMEIKKYSLLQLKMQLLKIGFEKELIENKIAYYIIKEDFSDEMQALSILKKKYTKSSVFPENNRALAFLGRKGFSYHNAKKALEKFKNSFFLM